MGKRGEIRFNLKKKILFIFLALLVLYALWLGFNILSFKTYKTPVSKAFPLEIQGIYHIHTRFSDGRKSPDEIAGLASKAGLNFIILTDHGSPNRKSYESQGWKHGVLVLAGSELSVSRGHLVGLGFRLPSDDFSLKAEEAVFGIMAAGGFTVIAHPYSKVQWSWGENVGYSGIEIINANFMLKESFFLSIPYLPALLIKPSYTLLKILDSPQRELRKWDELNKISQIYGYFSTDAHLLYRSALDFLRVHVILDSPLSLDFDVARGQVFEALRSGRFYNSIHAAAQAAGFRFWGERGKEVVPMGGTALLESGLSLHVQASFPFAKEIHLIQDGKSIFRSTEENIYFEAKQPGVYRVEAYLREKSPLGKEIPWIVSNPIFLREDKNVDR
jgi:hypothetical protein